MNHYKIPLIALADGATWTDYVEHRLHEHRIETMRHTASNSLPDDLIDAYPALLIVDGTQANWVTAITRLKTDQATRRIPILVIAPDQVRLNAAQAAGANSGLLLDELDEKLLSEIETHRRVPDPAVQHALDCQCQDDLPPLARLGVEKFNAGDYYAQHDAFEAQWLQEPGPVRDLYRAILQVGVAYYHLTQGNPVGALRLLKRSVQWFAVLPDVCQGVDVRQLHEDARRVRMALQAADPGTDFDLTLLKPLKLIEP